GDMQWEVVGVVGNESARTLDLPNLPVFYFHYGADRGLNLVVRTAAPAGLGANIRSIVNSLDANAPVSEVLSMQQIIENSPVTFVHRYPAILLSGFGLLSLILALVGIYGVVAYSVAQRTREIGIRIALGARSLQVLDAVLRRNVVTLHRAPARIAHLRRYGYRSPAYVAPPSTPPRRRSRPTPE